MKNVLIISFDLIRNGEVTQSLSIASLLAYLKSDHRYGEEFTVYHLPFNMFHLKNKIFPNYFDDYLSAFRFEQFDTIAISGYVWNEYLIKPLIDRIKFFGFFGKIVLGGYQISYSSRENLKFDYPDADIFIIGYAEKSLLQAIFINKPKQPLQLNYEIDVKEIPSVYTTHEILVKPRQKMVRLETKRGCPYRCSFCSHRDLQKNKVYKHEQEKIFSELAYLKNKHVEKINVLDPVFNVGNDYLKIMQEIKRIDLNSIISLQTKFEMIKGEKGKQFLDLATEINAYLEFGIQTTVESECNAINRHSDKTVIKNVLHELKARQISYEVSLIYGLPIQTVDTFQYNIDFLQSNGCENITAYPLMLLKGTELYEQKKRWKFVERKMGDFHLPTVVSSNTFSERDWLKMKEISDNISLPNDAQD